ETGSFYFSQRRFYQSIKGGKKDTKAEEFVGDSFSLAILLKDYNCINSNIFFQKARYYGATDHKEEMLNSIRDCLIMGLSKNRFLQDKDFQHFIQDSNFIQTLKKYHTINNEVQKVIETIDIQTFENILSSIPSFLSMQILTPKGFGAFVPQGRGLVFVSKIRSI
ncbi:hypothetical protein LEP1GSC150_0167, partial [Leptospira interrogans serovar Copenhageni str. LT2050]